jgi:hypothetical protein
MNRLPGVIAPMLGTAGLDVRTVSRAGGDVHELVITNPARPDWGRIVRADQKDSGNIVLRKCNHHPEYSGKVRYTDIGEEAIARQPVV